jgi:hypothetical protein
MCNLYAMTRKEDDLARFFLVPTTRRTAFQPLHEAVAPKWIGLDLIVADIGDGLGGTARLQAYETHVTRTSSRSPSDAIRTIGAVWRGKIALTAGTSLPHRASASPTAT